MGIISWIVLGLIAGSIAKAILPGKTGGGWLTTLVVGVVGALVGGFLGSAILHIGLGGFFELRTWLLAVGGSIVVLFVWGLINKNKTSK